MSRKEYEMVLNHHGIPKNIYAIGEEEENRICFMWEEEKFLVFRYKNGERSECKEFEKELDACSYFFQKLLEIKKLCECIKV